MSCAVEREREKKTHNGVVKNRNETSLTLESFKTIVLACRF